MTMDTPKQWWFLSRLISHWGAGVEGSFEDGLFFLTSGRFVAPNEPPLTNGQYYTDGIAISSSTM